MFSNDTINSIKNAYANGTGTFENVCKAAGLDYYKAGTNPAKKRGTPTTNVNGKVYDFHGLLRLAGVDIVKHERLTAGGERIPAQRSKVEKVDAAFVSFVNRIKDICGVDFGANNSLNNLCKIAKKEAEKLDKQAEKERAAAIEAQKAARKQAKAEKALESYSIEEIEALLEKRKEAAKVK